MLKVRVLEATEKVPPILEVGDVFIEYFDNPMIFYRERLGEQDGIGLDIRILDEFGGYLKYFKELEDRVVKETAYFKVRKAKIMEEVFELGKEIAAKKKRVQDLLRVLDV